MPHSPNGPVLILSVTSDEAEPGLCLGTEVRFVGLLWAECRSRLVEQAGFPGNWFSLSQDFAVNTVITKIKNKIALILKEVFFKEIFTLDNWLTVLKKLFSLLIPYKSQFQMD